MRMSELTCWFLALGGRVTLINGSKVLELQTRVKVNYDQSKYLRNTVRLKTISIRLELEFLRFSFIMLSSLCTYLYGTTRIAIAIIIVYLVSDCRSKTLWGSCRIEDRWGKVLIRNLLTFPAAYGWFRFRGSPLYSKELRGIIKGLRIDEMPWESSTLWKVTKDPVDMKRWDWLMNLQAVRVSESTIMDYR